jgi:hypothetical protein
MSWSIPTRNDCGVCFVLVSRLWAHSSRSERYVVRMSRNSYGLLIQWLSGAALDEEWDMGLHSVAGRGKEAARGIINSRLQIEGECPAT